MGFAGLILMGIGVVLLLIGIICILGGKFTWKYDGKTTGRITDMCFNAYDYNRGKSGKVAAGIVVGGGSPGTRCPVYEYCVNGITYRRASSIGWNIGRIMKKIENESPINVYYKSEDPFKSTITKSNALKIVGISISGSAAVVIVLGFIFALVYFL